MNTNELNQKIASIEAELAEMKALLNKPVQAINYWQPNETTTDYWHVSPTGTVLCSSLNPKNDKSPRYRVFKTAEEAEKYAEYIKAEETIRKAIAEANEGWVPNWDTYELKCVIGAGFKTKYIKVLTYIEDKLFPNFMYIKSKELAETLMKEYKEEFLTYLSY